MCSLTFWNSLKVRCCIQGSMIQCTEANYAMCFQSMNVWRASFSKENDRNRQHSGLRSSFVARRCKRSNNTVIRPPVRSNGRTYKMLFFLFSLFFRHAFFEFPRPIALKLCPLIGTCVYFITQVQKLGGTPPKKFGGQKHAKFRSILDHFRL